MKTKQLYLKLIIIFYVNVAILTLISCGSFQGSSYFASDGIYVSDKIAISENSQLITKNNYYQQYFKNAAETGYIEPNSDQIYFTDTDAYESTDRYQEEIIEENKSQIPWGEETSQTEIILMNNRPNFFWGLSGFAFNYSPFRNNFFMNPYRFGYGGFNPWFNFNDPLWNPYGGFGGIWGGFDPFYSPYSYNRGFYSPYGFGLGFGFRNRWYNRYDRFNRFNDFYGNNFRNKNNPDYRSTIARIRSGRGEKTYTNSNDRRSEQSKNQNNQKIINRVNLGRGVNSIGRTSQIRYNINRYGTTQGSISNSIRNVRPGINVISRSRNLGLTQGNTNITKTPEEISRSSGRIQTQYRLVERNPNRTSSIVQRRPSSLVFQSSRSDYSRQINRLRESNRGQYNRTLKSSSSNNRSQSNYTRGSNTISNSRSFSRSNNSGSRSSYSSGNSRSSSGRSSSSSGGRRN